MSEPFICEHGNCRLTCEENHMVTPEQIAEAGQRLAEMERRWNGRTSQDVEALRIAQQALREWVPRSEREHIATVLIKYLGWVDARRLLKLEDTP